MLCLLDSLRSKTTNCCVTSIRSNATDPQRDVTSTVALSSHSAATSRHTRGVYPSVLSVCSLGVREPCPQPEARTGLRATPLQALHRPPMLPQVTALPVNLLWPVPVLAREQVVIRPMLRGLPRVGLGATAVRMRLKTSRRCLWPSTPTTSCVLELRQTPCCTL